MSLEACLRQLWSFRDLPRTRLDCEILLFAVPTLVPSVLPPPPAAGAGAGWTLRLEGTLPIAYLGRHYDIPVELRVMEGYPRERPLFFVRPTRDMVLAQPHPCVGPGGEVTHSYLTRWLPAESNLAQLVTLASEEFSTNPPVLSRPPGGQPPPPAYTAAAPPPAYQSVATSGAPHNATNSAAAAANTEDKKKQRLVAILTARLRKSIKEEFHPTIKRDFRDEMAVQARLDVGSQEISKCCARLREYNDELEAQREDLEFRLVALRSWVEENNARADTAPPPNYDDVVRPQDERTAQLFENVAETNAIEDCLFHLDRALHRGRVDLKTFLRHVRELSRDQFFSTALSLKVLEQRDADNAAGGAGAGGGGGGPRYPTVG